MHDGRLDSEALDRLITDGDVDTVLVVFPDLQGRLVGKRVTGHFFADHVLADGIEACNYLLAVDVDMTPLPGYEYASWDKGYGDFVCRPDLSTARVVPWLEKTALVLCDLFDGHEGGPVEVSPRRILQRQLERAAAAGYSIKCGSELEFFLFRDSYEEAQAKGYGDLEYHSQFIEDYHILQTTRDEYLIRQIRNGMDGCGVPVEFSKGEAARGQHEINLRYADALEMADRHVIYKNGAKEIAGLNGRSITFMAKYDDGGVRVVVSPALQRVGRGGELVTDVGRRRARALLPRLPWVARRPDRTRGELAWMFAPTVNSYKRYQPESWAPTALAWGRDNRSCGYRVVGHGQGYRVENRIPGADCNPYLAFAATIAAGLDGIEHGIDAPARFEGNAYEAGELGRVPWNIVDAIDELEASSLAAKAFGADVHHHLVNTAKQEWAAFSRVVTDWERRRCFEQF